MGWVIVFALATSVFSQFEFKAGDHVCLTGNALGERLQHQNWFETLLHQNLPDKKLTLRNLCFPGDEPFQRERSENFGSPDVHLAHSKATVVVYFFGFNESFHGKMDTQAIDGRCYNQQNAIPTMT